MSDSAPNSNPAAEAAATAAAVAAAAAAAAVIRNKAVPTKSDLKKKAKQQKDLEANLNLLHPDSKIVQEEKAFSFAQAYFLKVRDKLDENVFSQFIEILNGFDIQNDSVVELYRQIVPILQPFPDLSEEFLAFLLPDQAMEVGRYMDYLYITKMKDFFRKLEVFFAKQPQQMRKIYEGLTKLSEQSDVSLENVKRAILPLLKSSSLLTDYFLQLFPEERPPFTNSSQAEFEKLENLENIPEIASNSDWEVVKIPDLKDPFGGSRCPCDCHVGCSSHHCIRCGLKFIKGRIFIQKGKVLRHAKLVFEGPNGKEILERIGKKNFINPDLYKVQLRKRPAESSPVKNNQSSSGTEADDESDIQTESKMAKVKPIKILKSKTSSHFKGEGDFRVISSEDDAFNYDSYVILEDFRHSNEMEEEDLDRPEFDSGLNLSSAESDNSNSSNCNLQVNTETLSEEDCLGATNSNSIVIEDFSAAHFPKSKVKDYIDVSQNVENNSVENTVEDEDCVKNNFSTVLVVEPKNDTEEKSSIEMEVCKTENGDLVNCDVNSSNETNVNQNHVGSLKLKIGEVCDKMIIGGKSGESTDSDLIKEDKNLENTSDCHIEYSQGETFTNDTKDSLDGESLQWTREEDKVILQTFQQEGDSEQTFTKITEILPTRSVADIQSRFQVLMQLLNQMACGSSQI